MRPNYAQRNGFSLIELLIVIGLVTCLIALVLPVVARARQVGRSTVCLAHLQQWGQSFQMYLNNSHGRSVPEAPSALLLQWWELLAPYNGDVQACLICPEASEPRPGPPDRTYRDYKRGSSYQAWHLVTYNVGEPQWVVRGDYNGSYGINVEVMSFDKHPPLELIKFPPTGADRIPVFGDCRDAKWPGPDSFALDRHRMAVNLGFLDGHAEHVPLSEFRTLKWFTKF